MSTADIHIEWAADGTKAIRSLRARSEDMLRALDDAHRWRDPHTGRFAKKKKHE